MFRPGQNLVYQRVQDTLSDWLMNPLEFLRQV